MIVTSFSQKGYHLYGKKFISTFLEHTNNEKLAVFYENNMPSNRPDDGRIIYKDLVGYDGFIEFCKTIQNSDPLFRGLVRNLEDKDSKDPIYNFRFDAFRFFRKVFAITQANKFCKDRYLTWIDADVYFYENLPDGFFETVLSGKYLAYLGRPGIFSECGFMTFDRSHDVHATFMKLYWDAYSTGAFRMLGQWHDCYVFDFIRELLNVPSNNLAKGHPSDHPFVDSVLGKYMDHLKGPDRKEMGRSPELENRLTRKEAV